MENGSGIAIVGIWIGVGMIGLRNGSAAAVASFPAVFATFAVASGA